MSQKINISVIIPLYNEQESIIELIPWVDNVMKRNEYSYELIMIDDGSNDSSWSIINNLKGKYPIHAIQFRRNFGKSAALYIGFDRAKADVVITMDADLQDSPEEIPQMYKMITEQNYDIVCGWKQKRHDPITKRLPSKFFNKTARLVSGIKIHDFNCGLKAYKLKVVKSIEVYGEMHRYIPILVKQAGFNKIGEQVVKHQARKYGYSKFGWERIIKGYIDLLTVMFTTKFGKRPMYIFSSLGTVMFLIGAIITAMLIWQKLSLQSDGIVARGVTEQPLFFIALSTAIIGSQLFLSGFLGEIINRSSTSRNEYLIDEEF